MTPAASILVVDDDVDTCRNLSDILSDLGYRVDTAYDGETALETVRRQPYDGALLDLRMPGMDGLSLFREIKKRRPGIAAILVTAYATSETAGALGAGAWQVMPKPVDCRRLLRLVEQIPGQPLVLVVDDDRELCQSVWQLLRKRGYRACMAHDEREAAERLEAGNHQVLLLDWKLPGGDGRQLFERVRGSEPNVRTVLITGCRSETQHDVEALLAEAADAVCYKPFDMPKLLQTLQQLTG